ncbi:hypothetical protein SAMN02745116_00138 [Pilibacter termitis]|uniref:Uncharacterized protein n=1 Tax=Pilibacter termitis TaxID=263852 RepID=A0A1T4K7R0_9ENTE|nr:hypothetical protein [Pilibacter termitis]SJZ38462.1 hypothetical protein SAMN02745116_00138 [Pilibacter termitis]
MIYRNSDSLNTKEWKSYYLSIGLTSKFIDETLQYFLDKGWIEFGDFFRLVELKKQSNDVLVRKLMPNYLADKKFLTGAVTMEFLLSFDLWGYYLAKYLYHYQAIIRFGQRDEDLSFIYENLILDFKENVEKEFELLRKYSQVF